MQAVCWVYCEAESHYPFFSRSQNFRHATNRNWPRVLLRLLPAPFCARSLKTSCLNSRGHGPLLVRINAPTCALKVSKFGTSGLGLAEQTLVFTAYFKNARPLAAEFCIKKSCCAARTIIANV